MDLFLLSLSLCWWTVAGRVLWSDKPSIILSRREIKEGETVDVTCTVPIDYRGGDCRLYRENSRLPFKVVTSQDYLCNFRLTSQELLGHQRVGNKVYFLCDYHLQQYTSPISDIIGVTVWGTRPSPTLTVSRRFLTPDGDVEVTCSPPQHPVSTCQFHHGRYWVSEGPCSQNLTGEQLFWEKPALLHPVNLTCTYNPHPHLYIRSEPSNHQLLFVIDPSLAPPSPPCRLSVQVDHLSDFEGENKEFTGEEGQTVSVHVTTSNVTGSCET